MGKIKTRKFLRDSLRDQYEAGHGVRKHDIKDAHNSTPYIHSHSTWKTYTRECERFGCWCRDRGLNDPEEAKGHIPEYLAELAERGMSGYTQATAANAIAKAYRMSTREIDYKLPVRRRDDIHRSRGIAERDKHFSVERNRSLIDFCCACGLRRSELRALKGSDVGFKDGKTVLYVRSGKGGKERFVELVRGQEDKVVNLCRQAGTGNVFVRVHSDADIHYYRSIYACRLYRQYARPIDQVPPKERYCCRGERKGEVYDRKALEKVSKNLGHNRCDVVVNNYLHNLL